MYLNIYIELIIEYVIFYYFEAGWNIPSNIDLYFWNNTVTVKLHDHKKHPDK